MLLSYMIKVPVQCVWFSGGNVGAFRDRTDEPRADSSMERILMRYILFLSSEVHARGGRHKTLIVMAFVVSIALPPAVAHFIMGRAVIYAYVRHIAHIPAFIFCHSASVLSSMFDADSLCLGWHNQWYSVDAAINEPLMKVWLLLPQGAGIFIDDSQSQTEKAELLQ